MGRKAIQLSSEQIEFVKNYVRKSSHGSKMRLVEEFNRAFRIKYSYMTLMKFVSKDRIGVDENCDADENKNKIYYHKNSKFVSKDHIGVDKKCASEQKKKNNKIYYQKNSIKLISNQQAYYKNFRRRILFEKNRKYQNLLVLKSQNSLYSKCYYEMNKRRLCESAKLAYLRKRPVRLFSAKISRNRMSN